MPRVQDAIAAIDEVMTSLSQQFPNFNKQRNYYNFIIRQEDPPTKWSVNFPLRPITGTRPRAKFSLQVGPISYPGAEGYHNFVVIGVLLKNYQGFIDYDLDKPPKLIFDTEHNRKTKIKIEVHNPIFIPNIIHQRTYNCNFRTKHMRQPIHGFYHGPGQDILLYLDVADARRELPNIIHNLAYVARNMQVSEDGTYSDSDAD